ncbi:MAG: AAA family ATPase [Deltaproteobacteria bacterium]|nr:AAA family ATPase [Deltaproteobacteria bacterium]
MRPKQTSFPTLLSQGLEDTIRDANPWWRGERISGLPEMRRWAFEPVLQGVKNGLAPAVVLSGPRQVGKTTLLGQVIDHLLQEGIAPHRVFRMQFDELPELRRLDSPILDSCRWFAENILRKSFNQAAHDGEMAYIFLDEVQNLPDWAPQLKHLVDIHPVRVLITGSSALRIESGRDSLAGRISTLEMGPLLLREIAQIRNMGQIDPFLPSAGLGPLKEKQTWLDLVEFGRRHQDIRDQAFVAFSDRGGVSRGSKAGGRTLGGGS